MTRRLRTLVITTMGALVVPLLALVAAPASAATDACTTPLTGDLLRFRWTGDGSTTQWTEDANWEVEGAAGPLPDRAPTYYGSRPETDDSTRGLVCITSQLATTIDLNDSAHVHVLALEVRGRVTLDMNLARVMVYGAEADYVSTIGNTVTIEMNASTLGGPGTIRMHGTVAWGRAGYGASTLDHDFCAGFPPGEVIDACAGVSPGVRTGRLEVADQGLLLVAGRGVNLTDGYRVDVATGGTLRVTTANGYIGAARDTEIGIEGGGLFEFAGDGSVFEGRANGQPDGDLAGFENLGTVRKSAGTGRSSLNVIYSGAGDLDVQTGSLSIAGGTEAGATVDAGSRIGTLRCGGDDNDGSAPQACVPETSAADPQFAVLRPDVDAADVSVVEGLTTEPGSGELQPAVRVRANDGNRNVPSTLYLHVAPFPGRPKTPFTTLFYRRSDAVPARRLSVCGARRAIPRGVTACIIGRRGTDADPFRIQVKTRKPTGLWSLRPSGVDFMAPTVPLVGATPGCQVMHPRYPYVARRPVFLREAGRFAVRFARTENTLNDGVAQQTPSGSLTRRGARGRNDVGFQVHRNGFVAVIIRRPDGSKESTGAFRVVATPIARFFQRSRATVAGRRMLIRGDVNPGGRRLVTLYVDHPVRGGPFLTRTAVRVRTNADGHFTLRYTPSRRGRFVFAVSVAGSGGLTTAMSWNALKVRVKPRPRREVAPPDDVVTIPSGERTYTAPPPRYQPPPAETFPPFIPRRTVCRFQVRY